MNYKQLIEGQRYQIEAYLREGFSYREIGKRLKASNPLTAYTRLIAIIKTEMRKSPPVYTSGLL